MAIIEVKVPQLSESVAEATLLQWKKQPGEAVALDEILIEIETDKVVLEVPAPAAGVLAAHLMPNGATVVAEQVIRPTGLMDPTVEVRPAKTQVEDLIEEIQRAIEAGADVVRGDRQGVLSCTRFHPARRIDPRTERGRHAPAADHVPRHCAHSDFQVVAGPAGAQTRA